MDCIALVSKMVLAFLISLVIVVLTGEREREPGGKEKLAKEGIQEDRREMGRKKGADGGEESFSILLMVSRK